MVLYTFLPRIELWWLKKKTLPSQHFFWPSDTAILLLTTLPFSTTPAITTHLRGGSPLPIFVTESTSSPYRVTSRIYFSKRISFRTLLWVRQVNQFVQISRAGRLRIEGWRVGFSLWGAGVPLCSPAGLNYMQN